MKIKCRPEDFRVDEIADPVCSGGPFALYRLTKTSLGTPEAIGAICRAWRVRREDVGVGGLKDRHAVTRQFLSVLNGPRRNLRQSSFELEYVGQTAAPFDSAEMRGNRFEVVLRDLCAAEIDRLTETLTRMDDEQVANYFDDQRFGSVGVSGDFIARPWCLGDYERALWLAIAEPNEHDRPATREEKAFLREHWGDWSVCRRRAAGAVTSTAFECLCRNPGDFRGAFVRIPQHERRIYLAAFQSFLWNRVLAETIRGLFSPTELFEVDFGRAPQPLYRRAPTSAAREVLARPLPLPSARERAELGPLAELYERVAGEHGLECRQLRVKYPRDSFFSRGSRPALFRPQSVSWEAGTDELQQAGDRSMRKLSLRFDLPSGCYATVLIKRLAAAAGS